jgi:hypothetical protein
VLWRLNFLPEREVALSLSPGGGGALIATIPLASANEGDLLRWRLRISPGLYDPPEQQPQQAATTTTNNPPQQQQPPERYIGALVSSSPSALIPQPPPLEASPFSSQNLLALASPDIPEIHWWAPNEQAAISDLGSAGSVLYLPPLSAAAAANGGENASSQTQGRIYDAVHSERRGVTALAWKKPKLKFSLIDSGSSGGGDSGDDASPSSLNHRFLVSYSPEKGTKELRLNSYHVELGDGPSLLREAVALAVLRESGVAAPLTFHVRLFLNGRLLGLFGVIEDVDSGFLERRGLPSGPGAPLFESVSGEMSNLRGDLPASELNAFYGKTGDPASAADWRQLELFAKGLGGAGAPGDTGGVNVSSPSSSSQSPLLTRRLFLLDSANLPAIVNEAAAQTVLGNMDRCTKNFYVYRDPRSLQWYRFPWDVEASFGQDSGLGGKPGALYAVLADEQWNSPLYCDAQHPQDIDEASRPGLNTYFGSARGAARDSLPSSSKSKAPPAVGATSSSSLGGRRLEQQQQQRLLAEGPPLQPGGWPEPVGWSDPDAVPPGLGLVRLGAPSGTETPRRGSGAAFTYNHLTAALLDVPETRAMYLRRLRTLSDIYYGGGQPRVAFLVRAAWKKIAAAAQEDARLWARPDPMRGVQQILTEFVPIRARQLLGTYAPGGVRPLLPSAATSSASSSLRLVRFEDDGGASGGFLEVRNDAADDAVDASGWEVRSGGSSWRLPPGFVVPSGRSVFLARDAVAFRARAASPRGGEGNIFVPVFAAVSTPEGGPPGAAVGPGPLPTSSNGPGAQRWELVDASGAVVSAL